MKKTLGLGTGRIRNGNTTVDGMRVWKRKRRTKGKRRPPIFYVTFVNQAGEKVSRSTRQRLRSIAVPHAKIIATEKHMLLFPQPLPSTHQQIELAI